MPEQIEGSSSDVSLAEFKRKIYFNLSGVTKKDLHAAVREKRDVYFLISPDGGVQVGVGNFTKNPIENNAVLHWKGDQIQGNPKQFKFMLGISPEKSINITAYAAQLTQSLMDFLYGDNTGQPN